MKTETSVTVCIVTHNSARTVGRCLRALPTAFGRVPFNVRVVDGASTDATVAEVRRAWPSAKVVSAPNVGFARAANLGARGAQSTLFLFANPDTELPPGGGAHLVRLCRSPKVAAVSGLLVNAAGRLEPVGEPFPGLSWYIRRRLRFWGAGRGPWWTSRARSPGPVAQGPVSVPWLSGAALLVRADAFQMIGGFDENHFLYYEDIDLCRRLRARGGTCVLHPAVRVLHLGGQSAPLAARLRLSDAGEDVYFSRHRPWWEGALLRLVRIPVRLGWLSLLVVGGFLGLALGGGSAAPLAAFLVGSALVIVLTVRLPDFGAFVLLGSLLPGQLIRIPLAPVGGITLTDALLPLVLAGWVLHWARVSAHRMGNHTRPGAVVAPERAWSEERARFRSPERGEESDERSAVSPARWAGRTAVSGATSATAAPGTSPTSEHLRARSRSRNALFPTSATLVSLGFPFAAIAPGLLLAAERLPASDWLVSAAYGLRFFLTLALIPLAARVLRRPLRAVAALLGATAILALIGIVQYTATPSTGSFLGYVCSLSPVLCPPGGWDPHPGRLFSTWLDPNLLGGVFLVAIAILLVIPFPQRVSARLLELGAGAVLVSALALTKSRTALLALAALLLVTLVLARPWRRLWTLLSAAMAVVILLVPSLAARLSALGEADPTAALRFVSWEQARTHTERAPLFGLGYNTYGFEQLASGNIAALALHSRAGADNSFLTLLATTGIWGTAILGIPLLTLLWTLLRRSPAFAQPSPRLRPAGKASDFDELSRVAGRPTFAGSPQGLQKSPRRDTAWTSRAAALAVLALLVHSQFVQSLTYVHLAVPLALLIGASLKRARAPVDVARLTVGA